MAVLCVTVMCQEDDGKENSHCDQHQRECKPINVNGVLDGLFEDLPSGALDNAVYCLNRCVHPVDLRPVFGPRMVRLNMDMMEAKLAEENYGAIVDFDQFRANERQSKEAKASGDYKEKYNNGVGHGRPLRARRQAGGHDDACLIEEIGSSLEDAIAKCQESQMGMIFKRVFKRDVSDVMHQRQVKIEMRDMFMLQYSEQVIDAFCPHNKDMTNWCINSAMQGSIVPTEFTEPAELKTLYCEKHRQCNVLENECIKERSGDVVEMCKCFKNLYSKVQNSTCPGAKTAFDRIPGQCSDRFVEDIQKFEVHVHESCTDGSPPMSPEELIEFLGGNPVSDEDM